MSDTPRVDAKMEELIGSSSAEYSDALESFARTLETDLRATQAKLKAAERRSQEREAWLLGHITEEEHMRFVERFQ